MSLKPRPEQIFHVHSDLGQGYINNNHTPISWGVELNSKGRMAVEDHVRRVFSNSTIFKGSAIWVRFSFEGRVYDGQVEVFKISDNGVELDGMEGPYIVPTHQVHSQESEGNDGSDLV